MKAGDVVISQGDPGGNNDDPNTKMALDAKNAQGQDVRFKVTIGLRTSWKEIESTDTDSALSISFSNNNKFIEIIGTQAELMSA